MIGLIGKKIGMTQVFEGDGTLTPVTVIKFEDNIVVGERNVDRDGYSACILGTGDMKKSRATRPYAGQFADDTDPRKFVAEIRDFGQDVEVGAKLGVELFSDQTFVDVIGKSKGKGYQGVIKRHGFGGGRKSHGSKFHRGLGSSGMAATPSKVHKGTKMAGRMGHRKTTVQNLRVVSVDSENQLLLLCGAVPGKRNDFVIVKGATKKTQGI